MRSSLMARHETGAELEAERRVKFQGTARIRLESLDFPRQGANENVKRLKLCIEHEGCSRLANRLHVPAVIDHELLHDALEAANASHATLLSNAHDRWPALSFPPGVRLKCLRGWDRLQAGWESLPPKDRWWTVDLYLAGNAVQFPLPLSLPSRSRCCADLTPDISERLERSLREEFSNEASPSDGQIYCKIRQYSRQNNAVAERQWWAHLGSENKRRDLRRLLRHERYTAALDTLLEIPGLWEGVRGGMWKKMMDLGCEEV